MDGPAGLDDPHQGRKTQAWLAISRTRLPWTKTERTLDPALIRCSKASTVAAAIRLEGYDVEGLLAAEVAGVERK